jgi:hypothetical protein
MSSREHTTHVNVLHVVLRSQNRPVEAGVEQIRFNGLFGLMMHQIVDPWMEDRDVDEAPYSSGDGCIDHAGAHRTFPRIHRWTVVDNRIHARHGA